MGAISKGKGIVLIPPLLKYLAGPLLGAALLRGAAEACGHALRVVDLNARYLRTVVPTTLPVTDTPFLGDHAKPERVLTDAQNGFRDRLQEALGRASSNALGRDPSLSLTYGHTAVDAAAVRIADGAEGAWIADQLAAGPAPDLVGLSILYSGQVVWALAIAIVARRLWPRVPIIAGGPHVTALASEIARDSRYGTRIDGFVAGHAEQTICDCLNAAAVGAPLPPECIRAGFGQVVRARAAGALPLFDHLDLYGVPRLILPAQTSTGCPYGQCGFCTYPAIEGRYCDLGLEQLDMVVQLAVKHAAAVAIKDSLILPSRLRQIADLIAGRVPWSACTKLDPRIDATLMAYAKARGCLTMEFGIETLVAAVQQLINKRQRPEDVVAMLDAADAAQMPLILNYITDFPFEDPREGKFWLAWLAERVRERPRLQAMIERNRFQLERLAPLTQDPQIRTVETWPWASVVAWAGTAP